ncbi:MAG: glycosyltransferase [Ruminococcaceae bacterium]|nr:glycosyltransferase [Oscillospiraceae bacterium]
MRLQVLVATMRQTDLKLVEQMNLRCDAVIANQADRDEVVEQDTPHGRVKMITTPTRGVGLNRNVALLAADAELLLMGDDDVTYRDDMPQMVTEAFATNPQADVLIFGMEMVKDGAVFETRTEPARRLHTWNAMKFGTYRVAIRREALERANVTFHQAFGGGCPFSAGEDSLFLKACFDRGLRVYAHPYVLGRCCKDSSSWFVGYNEKYFYDKGVLVRHLFPRTAYLMALYFGACFRRETSVGLWKRLRLVYAGVRGGKRLIPYQEKR